MDDSKKRSPDTGTDTSGGIDRQTKEATFGERIERLEQAVILLLSKSCDRESDLKLQQSALKIILQG